MVAVLSLLLPLAGPIDQVKVFAVYEPVTTPRDVELLLRLRPDLVCRGWFKWSSSPRWDSYAPLAAQLRQAGVRVQGGITCAAVYPRENGIDETTFLDFTTWDPEGQPVKVSMGGGGWNHLSLYNPKVREYLKADVRRQIDAGAEGIWYDEIEGTYDWIRRTGFDPYTCAAFRDWLVAKYVDGQGWAVDDARWQTVFGIDLAKHGGTIRTFDYAQHVRETPGRDGRPLAVDPSQGDPRRWQESPSALFREWGYAWNRAAAGTFRFDTVQRMWLELTDDARRYAREKHGRELIQTYNHNGTARPGADFLQPHYGSQPLSVGGRLNGRESYLAWYEQVIADAAEVVPDQPVVFFVDWPGEADRLVALPRCDQVHFLLLYIAEAYAAGGEHALPARGYSYHADAQDTFDTVVRLADFIREHHGLFRGSTRVPGEVTAPGGVSARLRRTAAGTALHLINHRWSITQVRPEPFRDLEVTVPVMPGPLGAFAVSAEWGEQRPVTATPAAGGSRLRVPGLSAHTLVVLPDAAAWQRVEGTAGAGCHVHAVGSRAAAVADAAGRFQMWLPAGFLGALRCLETAQELPAAGPLTFASPPAGGLVGGVLTDEYGAPVRDAAVTLAGRALRTDAVGRFATRAAGPADLAWTGPAGPATVTLQPGVSEVRPARSRQVVIDGARGLLGWWANWPERGRGGPEPIAVDLATHADRQALRIRFLPVATAWRNTNSAPLDPRGSTGLELVWAGDGQPATVRVVVQVFGDNFEPRRPGDTFYAADLPLPGADWTTLTVPWSRLVAPSGEKLSDVQPRRVALQFSPSGAVTRPVTLFVATARLRSDEPPLRVTRHVADATLETFDLADALRGHQPLPRPTAPPGEREVLDRWDGDEPLPLLNWQGREANGPVLLSGSFVTPGSGGAGRCLRLVFQPGPVDWANANFPLPADCRAAWGGVALRLRTTADDVGVDLAIHCPPGSLRGETGSQFYHAELLLPPGEWQDVVVPWESFRSEGQRPLPAEARQFSFQINRPRARLDRAVTVDVDELGLWRAAR